MVGTGRRNLSRIGHGRGLGGLWEKGRERAESGSSKKTESGKEMQNSTFCR